MLIFLVGFMGCGKTYIGKKLADRLYFSFEDLDKIIEKSVQGTSLAEGDIISNIFSVKGETYFRQLESDCLKSVKKREDLVVATGGGAACFHNNMDWMNENGVTIYLRTKPELLLKRLSNAKTKRPLLNDRKGYELLEFIKNKVAEREQFYSKAHIIIQQDRNDENSILKTIEEKLTPLLSNYENKTGNL